MKYRIFDKELKQMYKPTYRGYEGVIHELSLLPSGDLTLRTKGGNAHESTFRDKYIVCMSTEREDKNGIEIYEGDVVKLDDGYAIIKFDDGMFYFDNEIELNTENSWCGDWNFQDDINRFVITGNIYE